MAGKSHTNVHSIRAHDGFVERNPGMDFNPDLFGRIRINRSAVERRAATIGPTVWDEEGPMPILNNSKTDKNIFKASLERRNRIWIE